MTDTLHDPKVWRLLIKADRLMHQANQRLAAALHQNGVLPACHVATQSEMTPGNTHDQLWQQWTDLRHRRRLQTNACNAGVLAGEAVDLLGNHMQRLLLRGDPPQAGTWDATWGITCRCRSRTRGLFLVATGLRVSPALELQVLLHKSHPCSVSKIAWGSLYHLLRQGILEYSATSAANPVQHRKAKSHRPVAKRVTP